MNGMLQPHHLDPEELRLHHEEVQRSVRAGELTRLAQGAREQARERGRGARLLSLVTPVAIALGIVAAVN